MWANGPRRVGVLPAPPSRPVGRNDPVFANDAVARMPRCSNGLPRALNNVRAGRHRRGGGLQGHRRRRLRQEGGRRYLPGVSPRPSRMLVSGVYLRLLRHCVADVDAELPRLDALLHPDSEVERRHLNRGLPRSPDLRRDAGPRAVGSGHRPSHPHGGGCVAVVDERCRPVLGQPCSLMIKQHGPQQAVTESSGRPHGGAPEMEPPLFMQASSSSVPASQNLFSRLGPSHFLSPRAQALAC